MCCRAVKQKSNQNPNSIQIQGNIIAPRSWRALMSQVAHENVATASNTFVVKTISPPRSKAQVCKYSSPGLNGVLCTYSINVRILLDNHSIEATLRRILQEGVTGAPLTGENYGTTMRYEWQMLFSRNAEVRFHRFSFF